MPHDDYLLAGQLRWNRLDEVIAQESANMVRYRNAGDYEGLSQCIQIIANAQSEKDNLTRLHNEVVASEQAAVPRQQSEHERDARPMTENDWSDAYRWASKS